MKLRLYTRIQSIHLKPIPMERALLGGGCFWCTEGAFKGLYGVETALPAYAGGHDPNPRYEPVCAGTTGHAEIVEVVFDPDLIPFETILEVFFTVHDPTQLNRQGNDVGTQYRSRIYFFDKTQEELAVKTKEIYQAKLDASGFGAIVTEILPVSEEYYAEDYHQQYLAKNPNGYCGHGGCGVKFK